MPLPLGFYQTNYSDPSYGEVWEVLIEENKEQQIVFQIHTLLENSWGYSECWCEGQIEVKDNQLFFREKIGYNWSWKDADKQYHLLEIKDGFRAVFHPDGQLKIANVVLSIIDENMDLTTIKEKFAVVKEQLNEILTIKSQYPTEVW